MQESAPELMDIGKESKETLAMYGAVPGKASYANNCLLARRLIERGVRFVQLYHEAWDHHSEVAKGVRSQCGQTDQPTAALIKDLKQRGLLDDTLIVWGGEFGRTPMVESDVDAGRSKGRDHHNKAFTVWVAGGGIKRGLTLGTTDDLGFNAVEDRVHVHDLHATLLHLLGLDHEKLTYRYQGRDFRLTDVQGLVVDKLLA
jgi:arylsulfatase A-like enzyme